MKRVAFLSLSGFLIASFLFQSCKKDINEQVIEVPTNYDKNLTDALNATSQGWGLSHFMLPESNDYSSIPQDPLNQTAIS
jgi:cytochrome c peroxidase